MRKHEKDPVLEHIAAKQNMYFAFTLSIATGMICLGAFFAKNGWSF